jgi:hypothetical protein
MLSAQMTVSGCMGDWPIIKGVRWSNEEAIY